MSLFERNEEASFMMKHFISSHWEERKENVRFRFEVKKYCRTAFERQIFEAVAIKRSRNDPQVSNLNSKCEYTRCILPDIRDGVVSDDDEEELKRKINEYKEKMKTLRKRKVELEDGDDRKDAKSSEDNRDAK